MTTATAARPAAPPVHSAPPKQNRVLRGVATVLVGVAIWLVPVPAGLDPKAWHLLAIFLATIVGLILQPLPMGALALVGTTVTMATHTLEPAQAMAGYMNATVWLIVAAFLFARAFGKTGLGARVAYLFIRRFGAKTLGLGYALALTDTVLGPGIPSGAARTGGVLFPIVKSLAVTYGSEPGPTARRIGTYLMLNSYMGHCITAAMFMTAMVANPLMVELAREAVGVEISWIGWTTAAIVPALISLAVLPYLIFRLTRPEIRETPEAAELARSELVRMGPMTRPEWVVFGVFVSVFVLWATSSWTDLEPTVTALMGLGAMLILGALQWDDVLAERAGWDALIWFGGLLAMAAMLNTLGLIPWFSERVGSRVGGWPWIPTLGVLALVYMYSHYFFAGLTAHATALFVPFLTIAVAAGAPPYPATLVLAYSTSLCACLTHYAGGPSAVYFGGGYTDTARWWKVGFAVSLVFVAVWFGIGSLWWKVLGLY